MRKYKLLFTDGTSETIEMALGVYVAWLKGKVKAREKGTYLMDVIEEEAPRGRKRKILG